LQDHHFARRLRIPIAGARGRLRSSHRQGVDRSQTRGDKGYDGAAVRSDIEQRGGEAVIPSTASRKTQHAVDKAVYALRIRIEFFFNRAKNSRRVAT